MSSELQPYGKKILDTFKKKIKKFLEDLKGENNLSYLPYLQNVIIHQETKKEFTVGIPLEKGRKVDFALTSVEYSMPLLATINFKDNFAINQIMLRIEFPSVLYGTEGRYPKVILSADLNRAWPGHFGLAWLPLTGSDNFGFYPYESQEEKIAEIENFYHEKIVDPLCDYLNSSKHIIASTLRDNIKQYLESDEIDAWQYLNPFVKPKKANTNILEVPVYSEYFEENDASILYFEYYLLKKLWIPPADFIVNIMQYLCLSSLMFDYDGNLVSDEEMKKVEAMCEQFEKVSESLEKKKRAVKLKEEWDPFKPVKTVERDEFGYAAETAGAKEHQKVLERVQKMKSLMQQKSQSQTETPTPPPEFQTPPEPQPTAPPTPKENPSPAAETPSQVPTPAPEPTVPEIQFDDPSPPSTPVDQPRLRGQQPSPTASPTPAPQNTSTSEPAQPRLRGQKPKLAPQPQPSAQPSVALPRLRGQKNASPSTSVTETPQTEQKDWSNMWTKKAQQTQPAPSAPPAAAAPQPQTSAPAQPSTGGYASPQDWFSEMGMRQFVVVGNGNDLPFRKRGDFRILLTLQSPFILTFARDQVRNRKSIIPSEAVKILFELYKSGHIKPV